MRKPIGESNCSSSNEEYELTILPIVQPFQRIFHVDCRVVSPLEGRGASNSADGFSEGGVGLGVKVSDLAPSIQRRLARQTIE